MGTRGRQSSAQLSVIPRSAIEAVRRPDVPDELDREEAVVWRDVVNRMPAEWFPTETHPLLVQYCRHTITARRVAEMVKGYASGEHEVREYLALLRAQEMESRAISSLATRMRLSQQTVHDRKKQKGPSYRASKLWENAD